MLLLGADVETSGLDAKKDRILELGMVLYDWDSKQPLVIVSDLVDPNLDIDVDGFTVPPEIVELTGITDEMLLEYGIAEHDAIQKLCGLAEKADFLVGHNCNRFDSLFVAEALQRTGWVGEWDAKKSWLDSIIDVRYPKRITTRNLKHLAAEHGFLAAASRRAVFDVLTMFSIMANYDLEQIIARSLEPIVYLQACVSFDDKEKAKERGYRWAPGQKVWWMALKQSDAQQEMAECGFHVNSLLAPPE